MWNNEDDLNAIGEYLIPVLASVESCRANEYWRKTFGQIEGEDALYVYGEFEIIGDATMLFSLISLRKIDEFLSDGKKRLPSDIRYSLGSRLKCDTDSPEGIGCCHGKTLQAPGRRGTWRNLCGTSTGIEPA
jgi:hypothetical protein